MADRLRSKPDKPEPARPPAEFGRKAIELAGSVGKTKHDLAAAAGRSGSQAVRTINRLARGKGSMIFAHDVKEALRKWGADIEQLPPIDDGVAPMSEWLVEWIDLGKQLHKLATPSRFARVVDEVREVVKAHKIVVEGEAPGRMDDVRAGAPRFPDGTSEDARKRRG